MKDEPFIQQISDKIRQLGLSTPAILLLEAHKPLAFIGSQLLLIAQPSLDIFLPKNLITRSVDFLAEPTHLEQLITNLETPPAKSSQNSTLLNQQEQG